MLKRFHVCIVSWEDLPLSTMGCFFSNQFVGLHSCRASDHAGQTTCHLFLGGIRTILETGLCIIIRIISKKVFIEYQKLYFIRVANKL